MNNAQDALDAKFKEIEVIVRAIDYYYGKRNQKNLLRELTKAKKVAQILKTEIEVTERDFANVEFKFKKYQASVDAGYDDNETLALRDRCGRYLEEIRECLVQLLREREQVMLRVSELELVSQHGASLEALKALEDSSEPESEFRGPEEIQQVISTMVRYTQYRSGWSIDPNDLEAAQVRVALAVGGPRPSIYLTADYDNGELSNAHLSCLCYNDQAHTQDKQDVLLKFMSFHTLWAL